MFSNCYLSLMMMALCSGWCARNQTFFPAVTLQYTTPAHSISCSINHLFIHVADWLSIDPLLLVYTIAVSQGTRIQFNDVIGSYWSYLIAFCCKFYF